MDKKEKYIIRILLILLFLVVTYTIFSITTFNKEINDIKIECQKNLMNCNIQKCNNMSLNNNTTSNNNSSFEKKDLLTELLEELNKIDNNELYYGSLTDFYDEEILERNFENERINKSGLDINGNCIEYLDNYCRRVRLDIASEKETNSIEYDTLYNEKYPLSEENDTHKSCGISTLISISEDYYATFTYPCIDKGELVVYKKKDNELVYKNSDVFGGQSRELRDIHTMVFNENKLYFIEVYNADNYGNKKNNGPNGIAKLKYLTLDNNLDIITVAVRDGVNVPFK